MWWNGSTSGEAGTATHKAASQATGSDRVFSILATTDDEDELDRSRPVPWDWPDEAPLGHA